MVNEENIPSVSYGNKTYYNRTYAAQYVHMTDTGFRRKIDRMKREYGIEVPLVRLPVTYQSLYIDKRILDVFKKIVPVGKEQEWVEELKEVIDTVNRGLNN